VGSGPRNATDVGRTVLPPPAGWTSVVDISSCSTSLTRLEPSAAYVCGSIVAAGAEDVDGKSLPFASTRPIVDRDEDERTSASATSVVVCFLTMEPTRSTRLPRALDEWFAERLDRHREPVFGIPRSALVWRIVRPTPGGWD
jgi:hypothetical protein